MNARVCLFPFAPALSLALALSCALAASAQAEDESTCVSCHQEEEDEDMRIPVPEWRESIHSLHYVSCDACHGGDPTEPDADLSMSEEAGFLDSPSWTEMADYCGICHEAIAESYGAGFFGRKLGERVRVPSCDTCHMPEDAPHRIVRSRPEQIEVAEACPGCLGVRDPEATILVLAKMREMEAATRKRVATVERGGLELADLRAELREIHDQYVQSIHEFQPEAIATYAVLTEGRLRAVSETASGYAKQLAQRRRYGFALLVALGILFIALLSYRLSLR